MNKKYIIGGIVLSLLIPAVSYADTTTSTGPTIAILDTAIDTSIPEPVSYTHLTLPTIYSV